jgi:hypothetical protein
VDIAPLSFSSNFGTPSCNNCQSYENLLLIIAAVKFELSCQSHEAENPDLPTLFCPVTNSIFSQNSKTFFIISILIFSIVDIPDIQISSSVTRDGESQVLFDI